MSDFGQRLVQLRKARNLTMREVTETLSIAISTYAGYESGAREPSLEVLSKLADFFNVSSDYLLFGHSSGEQGAEIDLKEMLHRTQVMFDGVPLSEAEKRKVEDVLTGLFWDAVRKKKSE